MSTISTTLSPDEGNKPIHGSFKPPAFLHSKDATVLEKKTKERVAPAGVSMQAPIEVSKVRFVMITLALMFSIFLFALGESSFVTVQAWEDWGRGGKRY